MRNLTVFAILFAILVGVVLFTVTKVKKEPKESESPPPTPAITLNPQSEVTDITASFTIITDGLIRSFAATKYHNRSLDVFIKSEYPTKVDVKKKGITWDDFFKTLPMKLTGQCLTTGDGETFCDSQDGILKFYLNEVEDKNLLVKEIKDDDRALIKFTSF